MHYRGTVSDVSAKSFYQLRQLRAIQIITSLHYSITTFNIPLNKLWVILRKVLWVVSPEQQHHRTEDNGQSIRCANLTTLSSVKGKLKNVTQILNVYSTTKTEGTVEKKW